MFKEVQSQQVLQQLSHNLISSNNKIIKLQPHKKELRKMMMVKMIRMYQELITHLIIPVCKSVLK
jgi:hypothetical protein